MKDSNPQFIDEINAALKSKFGNDTEMVSVSFVPANFATNAFGKVIHKDNSKPEMVRYTTHTIIWRGNDRRPFFESGDYGLDLETASKWFYDFKHNS